MLHRIKVLLLISLISLTSVNIQAQLIRKNRANAKPFKSIAQAEKYIDSLVLENQFSGTILVTADKEILIKKAYGMADMEENIPNNIETKINIGSINKAFTSICVMQLVDRGLINLEDKITQYIPELNQKMANRISIRNLLEMQSGLGSYHHSELFQENRKKLKNIEDYLPIIADLELEFKPGTKRMYSNSSYELLGILIQRVSGQNYYEYVNEHVYDVAGMHNTNCFIREQKNHNLAQGYTKYTSEEGLGMGMKNSRQQYIYNNNQLHPCRGSAAGGGYSTLDDLQKFVNALSENRLLSKESTDLVINRFHPDKHKRDDKYRAAGGSIGINAALTANFKNNTLVIVLSNYDPPTASNIAGRLVKTMDELY